VARHIFQACPVWIYTQSNITQAFLNYIRAKTLKHANETFWKSKFSQANTKRKISRAGTCKENIFPGGPPICYEPVPNISSSCSGFAYSQQTNVNLSIFLFWYIYFTSKALVILSYMIIWLIRLHAC
jgi:hypothetical protein